MAFKIAAVMGGDHKTGVLEELGVDEDDPGYTHLKAALQNWGSSACINHLLGAIEEIAEVNDLSIPWHID